LFASSRYFYDVLTENLQESCTNRNMRHASVFRSSDFYAVPEQVWSDILS